MSEIAGEAFGGVEMHDIASASVGDTLRVMVGHCGAEPRATLLVTDANGLFGLTVDTVRLMQIPALIPSLRVVGIGYPGVTSLVETVDIRARDLTPTSSRWFEGSGHADRFIEFVRLELATWLADRFPAVGGPSIYFGHSLGGLFGAHVLTTADDLFDHYVLSSPSLWWDGEMIFDQLGARPTGHGFRSGVFVGIGALETDDGRRVEAANLPDGHPAKPPPRHLDMVDDVRRFVDALTARNDPTLRLASAVLDDEFHATAPGPVLTRGLRHVFTADHTWAATGALPD